MCRLALGERRVSVSASFFTSDGMIAREREREREGGEAVAGEKFAKSIIARQCDFYAISRNSR